MNICTDGMFWCAFELVLGLHCVWRMEAYNNTVYTGHVIYIRELL